PARPRPACWPGAYVHPSRIHCEKTAPEHAMVHPSPSFAVTLSAPPSSPPTKGVVHVFARLWRILYWLWALALVGVALSLNDEQPKPVEAVGDGAHALLARPALAVSLGAALLLTWYALVAALYERRTRRMALASVHILLPVRRLRGEDFVPRYIQEVYLPWRDATDGAA